MIIIKTLMFHILLSLRGLILVTSKFLSLALLGSFAATILLNDLAATPVTAKVMMLLGGIFFTVVYWFYDYLIFSLKPKMLQLALYK